MTDLHDRIRAVVEERLRVAREATAGPWESSGPDTIAEWSIYATKRGWMVATASVNSYPSSESPRLRGGITGGEANRNAAFIAANDPADAIRDAECDLAILDLWRDPEEVRHLPPGVHDGRDPDEIEAQIEAAMAIDEVVRLMATRWCVEVDG